MDCNCKVLLYTGICAVIFFLVVLPMLDENDRQQNLKLKEHMNQILNPQYELNNPPKDDINKLDQKICSTSCCKHTQWLPSDMNDEKNKNINENYIASNLSCNNGTGGGCLCLKKEDIQMLQNKAGNSIPLCNKVIS
jgi:hypothetical protein